VNILTGKFGTLVTGVAIFSTSEVHTSPVKTAKINEKAQLMQGLSCRDIAAYWSKTATPLYLEPPLGVKPSDFATTLGDEKLE